jgi:hypothetical protein
LVIAATGAPLASAPRATTTTAMATKTNASGNQRSAQDVKLSAIRTSPPSPAATSPVGIVGPRPAVVADPTVGAAGRRVFGVLRIASPLLLSLACSMGPEADAR